MERLSKMIDYRVERWKGCKAYHIAGMRMDEVDPAAPMLQYICKALNLDMEQRFWLAWLYSTCYSAPTAFYMITHLPRPESISDQRMESWWFLNKRRMVFESDRRYVKNCNEFPAMFASYKEYTRGGALKAFLRLKKETRQATYDAIFADVGKRLYFFGRYSNFMYLETIYNLTKFPMWPTGLNLREARTSRNGLCYALGREDWVRKSGKAAKLTKEQFAYLQGQLRRLYEEICADAPDVPTTYWNLETSLCAYYKLFKPTRYAGYYIDRQMQEIEAMEKLAPDGANWKLLWKFRRQHFDPRSLGELNGYVGVRQSMMNYFLDTGQYTPEEMRSVTYR